MVAILYPFLRRYSLNIVSIRLVDSLIHALKLILCVCSNTVPPGPITNLVATSIGEREVSLSWLTGFNGHTPITAIEVDVIRAAGVPFRRVLGSVNTTTITGLMPFREYIKFSIAVVNLAGQSEMVNISARTLSLSMIHVVVHTIYL